MKKMAFLLLGIALAMISSGCVYLPGGTDLSDVSTEVGLDNITTGDGTFENYTATGHYTGTEVGIAVGLPGIGKFMELYPQQTNEALLSQIATRARDDQADAMINVTPHREIYTGFPFLFIGIYVDQCQGTGIKKK